MERCAVNSIKMVSIFCLISVFFILPTAQAAEPVWIYSSQGSEIKGVSVSDDGSVFAAGACNIVLLSRTGELLGREPYGEQVVLTTDGSSLLSSYLSTIYLFRRNASASLSPFNKTWEISMINRVQSIDISDDGKNVVVSVRGKGTYIYSSSGKLTGGDDQFNAVVRVSAKGEQVVGVSQDGLCLYSTPSKRGKCALAENVTVISQPDAMEITANGDRLVFNDDQRIISVSTRNQVLEWTGRATGDITALAMTPTGTRILVGTDRGTVDLLDKNGNLLWSYAVSPANSPSGAGVTGAALSSDGNRAVAGTYEGRIIALGADGTELWSNQTKDHIRHVAMSGDGSLVIATGANTVYAFSSSGQFPPIVQSPQMTTPSVQQNTTSAEPATTAMQTVTGTSRPSSQAVTSAPTPYSVIRTATQSPLPYPILFLGILIALIVIALKR
jgi:hypothetical protein